ncbi:phospholipase A and acyltransferase 3-like [Paroedura picta]|uniref:phospholipase A and acyltransferase 3-like n=1 Tax=Paroedura picta TaxID=143630 RepID=UPI004055F062
MSEVKPKPGDLIEIRRSHYQHWAIYIGNGYVVHLAPESEVAGAGLSSLRSVSADFAEVKKEQLWEVVGNDKYVINKKYDERFQPLPVDEIISRAKAMVGRIIRYSLLDHNCEHFVTKLRYGIAVSDQVTDGYWMAGGALAGTLAVGITAALLYKAFVPRRQKE